MRDVPAGQATAGAARVLPGNTTILTGTPNGKGKGITVNTADQAYIGAITNAVNAYATAMETFTLAAAATAAGALAASITTATNLWQESLHNEGE